MEELVYGFHTAGRVALASIFAMTPGTIFWLAILSIWLTFSRFAKGGRVRPQE